MRLPSIIAAPMAGGGSTPALVAAVNEGGGLGFLAAGYKGAELLGEQIAETRKLTDRPFGVNLFVPGEPSDPSVVAAYRDVLRPEAARHGVALPELTGPDRDGWEEKTALLLADPVPVLSYTLGLPGAAEAAAFRAAGSYQVATVTTVAEARAAAALGMDALCVQGPEAGGHRGTHRADAEPGTTALPELLREIAAVGLPMIAAGGLADGPSLAAVRRAGAVAAQIGTAYLLADESGANAPYRRALAEHPGPTTVTRAFTGRPARALRNAFVDRYGPQAPVGYPEVHHLTAPLRAAATARGDAEAMHLWAGTAHRLARPGRAADLTREFVAAFEAAGGTV
ncbi:nitronate monooxygenase [Kitasatospora sp. NPDC096147]|uniref:nitronate monooxygenase n=1 Tax=Kitasatospora sp. NPDC096147 TaxID=3364093 RepID=UPI0038000BB2